MLQMEASECGAASLGMILGHFGRFPPLEELRRECGVSRDGSKASNIIRAANRYGLVARGYTKEPDELRELRFPVIIHWNFNHFLVLEGFRGKKVYLNDPVNGRRTVTPEEFDQSFTGVVLTFEKSAEFHAGDTRRDSIARSLFRRIRGVKNGLFFVLILSFFLLIPGICLPVFLKVFIDDILLRGMDGWLAGLLAGMAVALLVRGFLSGMKEYFLMKIEKAMSAMLSSQFIWNILRLPVSFFYQRFSGDISGRIRLNDQVAVMITRRIIAAAVDLLILFFYAAMMFVFDPFLAGIGVGIAFLNIACLYHFSKKISENNMRLMMEQGKLAGVSMSGLQMIETLKANGAEEDFFTKWTGHHAKVLNFYRETGKQSLYLLSFPEFFSLISYSLILAVGGFRVMDGAMTLGMLAAFQGLMAAFLFPIQQLVSTGMDIQKTRADISRLDDILKFPRGNDGTAVLSGKRKSFRKLEGMLELDHVTFGYNPSGQPLIRDFFLRLEPGMRVALVGSSGCGKSTIARLVCGLYEPWSGTILFDGTKRGEIPRERIVNSLAMVDQDIVLFEDTVRNNITLWDGQVSEDRIAAAARDACIHEVILARKGGYEHVIEEGGRNFSGGERQRMEIARALVMNPRILILDEATSALDAVLEKRIDENIRRRGCTCIIVAHRLSTIRDCDEIIVLDDGMIVQRGRHEALVEEDGPYAKLIRE